MKRGLVYWNLQLLLLVTSICTYICVPLDSKVSMSLHYWNIILLLCSVIVFFKYKRKTNYFDFDTIFIILSSILVFFATFFYNRSYYNLLFLNLPFKEEYVNIGNIISLIGIQSYMLGSMSYFKHFNHNKTDKPIKMWKGNTFLFLMLSLFILLGGIGYYQSLYEGQAMGAGGIFAYILLLTIIIVSVNVSILFTNRSKKNVVLNNKFFFLTLAIFSLVLLYIGRRSFFLFLVFPFIALYTRIEKSITLKHFSFLFFVGIIVFWIVQNMRINVSIDVSSFNPAMLFTDLTIPSRSIYTAIEYVEENGYTYGESMLAGIIGLIPFIGSFFDSNKIYSAGLLTEYTFDSLGKDVSIGLGTTIFADVYLAWGILGVILFLFVLGRIVSYISCKVYKGDIYSYFMYAVLVSQCAFMVRDSFFSSLRYYVWGAIYIWCLKYITVKLNKNRI